MMRAILIGFVSFALAAVAWHFTQNHGHGERQTAIFAAGCFWGVQGTFDRVPGVVGTEAGYIGGFDPRPTHGSVSAGRGGHVEAVRVTYDPTKISYAELLDIFWSCHNPTIDLSTGPGEGAARSMIFTVDGIQDRLARQSVAELSESRRFAAPIVTQIVPATRFYPAESEHQHFSELHGTRCTVPGAAIHTKLAADAERIRTAS